MIKIEQKITNKLPGEFSLFISFDYKKQIVDTIKNLPGPLVYDKKNNTWEIPLTSLSKALDSLCLIDRIELKLLENKKIKNEVFKLNKYKTDSFQHQVDAVQYGLNNDSFLLLDSPGLGKSKSAINLAEELKKREKLEHCLIICGVNSLKYNWLLEIEKHCNLSAMILGQRESKKGRSYIGSIKDRVDDLKNKIKEYFVITNIETIRSNDIIKGILKGKNKFDLIIVDEIHTCFSGDTLITTDKGLLLIKDIVENQIACKVKTKDKNNNIQYNNIISYNKILNTEPLLKLTFEDELAHTHILKCTPDHLIHTTNRGYIPAKDINIEDDIDIEDL